MDLDIQTLIAEVVPTVLDSGLIVSLCSIEEPTGGFDAGGAPITGAYQPVAGLQNIRCMSAPESSIRANEVKAASEVLGLQFRHIWLAGFYPQIPAGPSDWQAIIDGTRWDLLGAECDSQSQTTRLQLRIASI